VARPVDTDGVRIRLEAGIATVVLHNPDHKNAATVAMWDELAEAFRWVATDPAIRVVVVSGAGEDFCAGADLGGGGEGRDLDHVRRVCAGAEALHDVTQPTIARVDGVAVGAGLNLALGCDLVVASDRARFSEIFTRRALSLDWGGSWLLPRRVGLHKAKELSLLAPIIGAAEAERIGLVNRVVPVEELDAAVAEWAIQLAAGPPLALANTNALLDRSSDSDFPTALEAEIQAQVANLQSEDALEAMTAFVQRRAPTFQGR